MGTIGGLTSGRRDRPLDERLRLARDAFQRYRAMCFWSWPADVEITPDLLPGIARALRMNGGRRQFILAAEICPSTIYNARYLPRYAAAGTPTAT